jgi:hypothetical protein
MNPARANPRASATLLAAATLLWAAAALPAPRVRQAKKPPPPAATPNTAATRNDAEASPEPQPGTGEIAVTVVEVSGGQVYLKPGTAGGVGRGARVRIRGKEYTVVQATDSFAAVAAGATPPKEGDRGLATRTEDSTTHVVILEKPKPLTTWTEAWTPPVPPASTQAPRFVPLGGGERDRRLDVRLATSTTATLPLSTRGANLVRALLNARLHVQPSDAPLAFDLDFTVQHYFD